MRAIFLSLLAMNIGLFIWSQVWLKQKMEAAPEQVQTVDVQGVPTFKLLGEMSDLKPVVETAKVIQSVAEPSAGDEFRDPASTEVKKPEKPLCEMVGAFRSKIDARGLTERLTAAGVASSLKEMQLPAGPGYWVYLEPVKTRKQAFDKLRQLQARGIDSYVIPKGDLANGISLGMFSQKNLAELRLKEMKREGLSPRLEVIERTYRELWVMLNPGEEAKMSQITWNRVLEGLDSVERRQNFCLDVAS